jgi:hypothetical protein
MGVMARKQGEQFIITSDRNVGEPTTTRAPKKRVSDVYQFWTGQSWSTVVAEAKTFTTEETADDYVRANFAQVMKV